MTAEVSATVRQAADELGVAIRLYRLHPSPDQQRDVLLAWRRLGAAAREEAPDEPLVGTQTHATGSRGSWRLS